MLSPSSIPGYSSDKRGPVSKMMLGWIPWPVKEEEAALYPLSIVDWDAMINHLSPIVLTNYTIVCSTKSLD